MNTLLHVLRPVAGGGGGGGSHDPLPPPTQHKKSANLQEFHLRYAPDRSILV